MLAFHALFWIILRIVILVKLNIFCIFSCVIPAISNLSLIVGWRHHKNLPAAHPAMHKPKLPRSEESPLSQSVYVCRVQRRLAVPLLQQRGEEPHGPHEQVASDGALK